MTEDGTMTYNKIANTLSDKLKNAVEHMMEKCDVFPGNYFLL